MATHAEIVEALSRRHSPPEWAFMRNVANKTGSAHTWADCVAMNLWASRGLELHAFEVKALRGDWQRELKKPAKAEPIFKYVDRWWVVANAKVVQLDELPIPWGLLEMRGQRLYRVKQAPALEPEALDRWFLAALLRRATQATPTLEELMAARSSGYKDGLNMGKQDVGREEGSLRRRIRSLERARDDFEAKSGIRMSTWDSGKVGEAVALIRRFPSVRRSLERTHEIASEIIVGTQRALENLDGERAGPP